MKDLEPVVIQYLWLTGDVGRTAVRGGAMGQAGQVQLDTSERRLRIVGGVSTALVVSGSGIHRGSLLQRDAEFDHALRGGLCVGGITDDG